MTDRDATTRRTYLAALAAGVVGTAGCGSSGDESQDTTSQSATDPSTRRPTASTTRRPTRTETGTGTETETRTTESREVIEFDGGGATAFADALAALAAEPGRTLAIAPGTHRLDASAAPGDLDVRTHFALSGAKDATIEGNGATLVFEDPTRGGLHVAGADGITVRNLTVDYDPVPYSQTTVRELTADGRELVVEVQSDFPPLSHRLFDRAARVLGTVYRSSGAPLGAVNGHGGHYKRFASSTHLGGSRFRLRLADGVGTGGLAVGRVLAVIPRFPEARLLRFERSTNPHLDAVTVRAAPGFAVYFNYCAGPVARNLTVTRPPGSDRVLATNADGIHVNNCREGPLVERCRLARTGDDAVVVDAQLVTVTDVVGSRTVRVSPSVGSLVGAGDRMAAASADFERKGDLPPVAEIDMQGGGRTAGPELPELITFESSVDDTLMAGDFLTASAFENRGFAVRNNEVRDVHARMVRIGGGAEGVVEGNRLAGNNNDGILVEATGLGAPKRWVDDVAIRNNTLADVGLGSVTAGRPEGIVVDVDGAPVHAREDPPSTGRPHRNVTIADNTVQGVATTGVRVADATDATVAGNRVVDPGRIRMTPLDPYGIGLDHVVGAQVRGNRVVGTADDVHGFGWRVASDDVRTSENELRVAGEQRPVRVERLW